MGSRTGFRELCDILKLYKIKTKTKQICSGGWCGGCVCNMGFPARQYTYFTHWLSSLQTFKAGVTSSKGFSHAQSHCDSKGAFHALAQRSLLLLLTCGGGSNSFTCDAMCVAEQSTGRILFSVLIYFHVNYFSLCFCHLLGYHLKVFLLCGMLYLFMKKINILIMCMWSFFY